MSRGDALSSAFSASDSPTIWLCKGDMSLLLTLLLFLSAEDCVDGKNILDSNKDKEL